MRAKALRADEMALALPGEPAPLVDPGENGEVAEKQAQLFRLHAAQDWSGIHAHDLQVDDTWVVVRDNNAYHTVNRFHPYFAMCPPPLARRAIEAYSNPGDVVVDPFCGAGVTLVEAMITGRHSIGVDVLS